MYRESLIMHDEKISCLVEIYASREDFIPRWNLYIARRIYASLEFMHSENHASRKSCIAEIMHRESLIMHDEKNSCLVKICTSREDLFLAESYASREDSFLAEIYVLREDIHAPQEDVHG